MLAELFQYIIFVRAFRVDKKFYANISIKKLVYVRLFYDKKIQYVC